jgi:uncharacterized protein involved in response to NO
MSLLDLIDPPAQAAPPRFALWALGFRPFYLLAALFAALAIPVWTLVLAGAIDMPLPGIWWHAHEMLFGYAAAVIVGFLFTAGRNWTGLLTPTGPALAALALLWLCGRLALAFNGSAWAAIIDIAFLPVAATALARVLVHADSRNNYFLPGLLLAMAAANVAFHLARFGVVAIDPLRALHFALGAIALIETSIAGRVIPMFTSAALRQVKPWQRPWLNRSAIAATTLALLLWSLAAPAAWLAPVAAIAALLQLARSLGWKPLPTRGTPLLWILHLSHLWIPVGLAFLAAAAWGLVPRSAAVHAFAIGATGGLTLGMMTRTALGHTGRKLGSGRVEATAYVLVQCAAAARILTLAALPAAAVAGIHVAAAAWSVAFLLYFARYLPWLIRARADGQSG